MKIRHGKCLWQASVGGETCPGIQRELSVAPTINPLSFVLTSWHEVLGSSRWGAVLGSGYIAACRSGGHARRFHKTPVHAMWSVRLSYHPYLQTLIPLGRARDSVGLRDCRVYRANAERISVQAIMVLISSIGHRRVGL